MCRECQHRSGCRWCELGGGRCHIMGHTTWLRPVPLAQHQAHGLWWPRGASESTVRPSSICDTAHNFPLELSFPQKSVNCACVHPCPLLSSWERGENVIWALFGLTLHSNIITLKCRFIACFMYIFLVPAPPTPLFTDTYTTCHVETINCWSYRHLLPF